jgi:glycosyltransferase involved in cell wall biosynthesis
MKGSNLSDIKKILKEFHYLFFLNSASIPYYIACTMNQKSRSFAKSLNHNQELKVAHFTDTFYEVNGVVKTLQGIAAYAKIKKTNYRFLTCHTQDSISDEKVFKPTRIYEMPGYAENVLAFPSMTEILDYCYEEDFTHIHSATPGPMGIAALIVAKILQKPFYSSHHTRLDQYVEYLFEESFLASMMRFYQHWYYGSSDKIFVRSSESKKELMSWGLNEQKVCLLPAGVDTEFFVPGPKQTIDDRLLLLYVGRVSKEKNLELLAEALESLDRSKITLTIVGDGPYLNEMKERLLPLGVRFTGYLHGEDLVREYQKANLFVLPSTTETLGNVVLEAQACGVPVLVTDIGGQLDHVENYKTGFIIKGNNVRSLVEGIEGCLANKERLQEVGIAARKSVEGKTMEKAFSDFLSCYD